MTLDEAIRHCEEVADTCEHEASKYDMTDAYEKRVACEEGRCAEEHRQLAEWLKELKAYKADEEQLKSCFYCGNRKSCKDYLEGVTSYACDDWKPCEDCISRQAALSAICGNCPYLVMGICKNSESKKCVDLAKIRNLPSVTPTKSKGYWLKTGEYFTGAYGDIMYVECSCCHEESLEEGNYCPNCGTKMERED